MQLKQECLIGMLEIYNESITDLLCPDSTNLDIREDAAHGTHVNNLSQWRVHAGFALTLLLSRTVILWFPLAEVSSAEHVLAYLNHIGHVHRLEF